MATHDIYEMELPSGADETVEEMAGHLNKRGGFGVTYTGNRVTLRWNNKQVHMLLLTVDDGRPEQRCPGCGQIRLLGENGLCTGGDCDK